MNRNKKKDEPLWCKMYRDEYIKPKQKERLTEQKGRTEASRSGFYLTKGWKKIRDRRIRENPLCQHCEKRKRITQATVVDHIIPVEEAPELCLDYDNTQSLCDFCHGVKTRNDAKEKKHREKLKRGKRLMDELEETEQTPGG